jgi:hypothetical protein
MLKGAEMSSTSDDALAMIAAKAHLRPRSAVGPELVGNHDAWRCDGGFEELPHKPLRRATVSSTLDQDVENEAILIDRAPKPVLLAGDRDDDLIHMPFVAARAVVQTLELEPSRSSGA